MPNIKLALTIEEMKLLEKEAEKEHLSVQDFIRYKLFSTRCSQIFTPEEAEHRALNKFQEEVLFSLPEVYGEEWGQLAPRMTGAFGKRFYHYLKRTHSSIVFVKMTPNRTRALYKIEKNSNETSNA